MLLLALWQFFFHPGIAQRYYRHVDKLPRQILKEEGTGTNNKMNIARPVRAKHVFEYAYSSFFRGGMDFLVAL